LEGNRQSKKGGNGRVVKHSLLRLVQSESEKGGGLYLTEAEFHGWGNKNKVKKGITYGTTGVAGSLLLGLAKRMKEDVGRKCGQGEQKQIAFSLIRAWPFESTVQNKGLLAAQNVGQCPGEMKRTRGRKGESKGPCHFGGERVGEARKVFDYTTPYHRPR